MGERLLAVFRRLIATNGPISIQQFMGESNARYYASRDPLGSGGDFVTAPEISQVFGELIGLWLADIWDRAGRASPVHYVELGPGRGTLARDALTAAHRFGLSPQVHLIESSSALEDVQRQLIPGATWHQSLDTIPEDSPLLIVGNEFLDALPIRQLVRAEGGWRERMVGLDGDRLIPVASSMPFDAAVPAEHGGAPVGSILESNPGAGAVVGEIARRLVRQGGAALLIDYGTTETRLGSTLQAVRAHRKVDPFEAPGEADLTALVDFSALRAAAEPQGARWLGTAEQGAWLQAMGIDARVAALAQRHPDQAPALTAARNRLVDSEQMGRLFKVFGLAGPEWPDGAGLAAARPGS